MPLENCTAPARAKGAEAEERSECYNELTLQERAALIKSLAEEIARYGRILSSEDREL